MKKLIIWFLPVVIYIMGMSNYAIADQITLPQAPEKEVVTEYPLKMGTANDKLILRVTEMPNDKEVYTFSKLEKIEILNNNKIIYTATKTDLSTIYAGPAATYALENYGIFKGANQEYFTYGIKIIESDDMTSSYTLLRIEHNDSKTSIIKLTEAVYSLVQRDFLNPKLGDHIYKLIEDKYIITTSWDLYFYFYDYYEIVDNSVRLTDDKEFVIDNDSTYKQQPEPKQMKVAGSIIIYAAPSLHSASSSIKLTEATQVEFIGIRNINNNTALVHVTIDGKEGWISEDDLTPKFGITPFWK